MLKITVAVKGSAPFYTKDVSANSWDQVDDIEMEVAKAMKRLGDHKRDHKKKNPGVDISKLPMEVLHVRVDTPDPDIFILDSIKVPSDPSLGARKLVTDSIEHQLTK